MIQELYAITASLVRFETAPHSPEDLEKELEYLESANRILQAAKRTLKVQFQYKNYSYAYALATQIKEAQIVYLRVHKCCVSQAQIELLQCARTRISDVQRVMRQLSLFTLCDLDIDRLQILRQCFTRIRTPRASEVVIAVQPTNTVLIRLREGQLPNELWDQVLSHIPEKQLRCLRRVDRHFNQVIEGVYFHAWRTLKHSPSKGLVDTRYLMGRIEGEFLGKSAVLWFKEIKEAFFSLPPEEKNLTYEMVWFWAGAPQTEDFQWGEHHVFDDRDRFYLAVRKTISTKLLRLSIDMKERVYENVFRLTENPQFNEWIWGEAVHCKWGELFVYDNFPRLADAMALLKSFI